MDEYIKREDALDAVLFALAGTGRQSTAIYAIREVPTADVVPKSEYDNLKFQFEALDHECDRLERAESNCHDAIEQAKTEVAREIFEEIEKVFERLKKRECSNAVCTWCVHANSYGQRNEECDKPYIDKNGKERKACYAYAKFESNIDNEFAELKKKHTEDQK